MVKISVIIGIYNCAPTLQEALDSLYTQTFQNFEIILCDDGSEDDTYSIALENKYRHSNIVLLRNEKNLGLNATLNKCIEVSQGQYIARMDGDDISLPTRFEKQVKFLDEHPEYAVVSSPMIYFDENGEFRRGKGKGEIIATDFVLGSPICHAPCMVRANVIRSVGGYSVDNKLLRVEDYHLWFKIFSVGHKLYMTNECLYKMRDDKNAYRRRTLKSRFNEAYVKSIGFRMIGLPFYYQVFALRPILIGLLPKKIYMLLHK
jgi:glycosyltransferase EpsE